jgi:hypothetical protein
MAFTAPAPSLPLPASMLRMRVAWLRPRLDAALAAGADPADRASLALRAEQLLDPRRRARFARSLLRAIESSEPHRLPSRSAAVPVSRAAVLEARPALLALASDLTERSHPAPQGVALAITLLTDGDGPLYRPATPGALRDAAERARAAL